MTWQVMSSSSLLSQPEGDVVHYCVTPALTPMDRQVKQRPMSFSRSIGLKHSFRRILKVSDGTSGDSLPWSQSRADTSGLSPLMVPPSAWELLRVKSWSPQLIQFLLTWLIFKLIPFILWESSHWEKNWRQKVYLLFSHTD